MADDPEQLVDATYEEQELEDLVASDFGLTDLRAETIRNAQTTGLRLTYEAATAMLKDPKTSPLARVACMKIVLDVGKQKASEREVDVKPEDETPEEFEQRYAEARARLAATSRAAAEKRLADAKAVAAKRKPKLYLFS